MAQILGELSYNNKTLKPIGRPIDDLKALYKDKQIDYVTAKDNYTNTQTVLNKIPTTGNAKDEEILANAKTVYNDAFALAEQDGDFENKIMDSKQLANDLANKYGLLKVQENALTRQAALASLKDRLDKGKITRQQYQNAAKDSDRRYKGIEKDEVTGEYVGNYNPTQVQDYVSAPDLTAKALENFKASTIILKDKQGRELVPTEGGAGYYEHGTLKSVSKGELVEAAKAYIQSNPAIQSQFQEDTYFELQNLLYDDEGNKRDLTTNDIRNLVSNSNSVELMEKLGINSVDDLNNLDTILKGKDLERVYTAIKEDQLVNDAMALGVAKESFEEYSKSYLKDWQLEKQIENATKNNDSTFKEQALVTINKIATTQRISPTDMTNLKTGIEATKQSISKNSQLLKELKTNIEQGGNYSKQEIVELEKAITEDNKTLENLERQKASIHSFVKEQTNVDIENYYNNYINGVNDKIAKLTKEYTEDLLSEKVATDKLYGLAPKYSLTEAREIAIKKAIKEVPKKTLKEFEDESIFKYTQEDTNSILGGNNRTSDFDAATRNVATTFTNRIGKLSQKQKTDDLYTFIVGDSDTKSHAMYRDYVGNINKAFKQSPENFISNGQDFTTLVDTELGIDYEDIDLEKSNVYPIIENVNGKPTYAIEVYKYTDDKKTKSVKAGKIATNYEGNVYGQEEVIKKVTTLEAAKYLNKLNNGTLQGHDLTVFRKLAQGYINSSEAGKNLDALNLYSAEDGKSLNWELLPNLSVTILPKKSKRKEVDGKDIDDLSYELYDKQGRAYGTDAQGNDTWGEINTLKNVHLFDNPYEIKEVVGSALLKSELNKTNTINSTAVDNIDFNKLKEAAHINLENVIKTESNGNTLAVNKESGATGLMQLLPSGHPLGSPLDDWNSIKGNTPYTTEDLTNANINKKIGTWYLTNRIPSLLNSLSVPDTAMHRLMAYNWGIGNVKNWYDNGANVNNIPNETKNYLQKILE